MRWRYQWLVECRGSDLTDDAELVIVGADRLEHHREGSLLFWHDDPEHPYILAAFAQGQWRKVEVTSAITGEGNAIFPATRT